MRRCQLHRIYKQLKAIQRRKKVLFYIDIFSIPVKQAHPEDDPELNREDLKMRAISKTNNIYALADNVLVLDAELQSISYHSLSPEELAARLATCAWQGRSWTFLESSLALRMYIQFRDGPRQFESLCREMEKARERILSAKWSTRGCMLLNLYDMAFLKIRRPAVGELLGKNAHKRYVRFSEIWASLSSCWTRELRDIFLILAK